MLLQTWITLNSKEDILKNVDNQTIVIPIDFHSKSMGRSQFTRSFVFHRRNSNRFGMGFHFWIFIISLGNNGIYLQSYTTFVPSHKYVFCLAFSTKKMTSNSLLPLIKLLSFYDCDHICNKHDADKVLESLSGVEMDAYATQLCSPSHTPLSCFLSIVFSLMSARSVSTEETLTSLSPAPTLKEQKWVSERVLELHPTPLSLLNSF